MKDGPIFKLIITKKQGIDPLNTRRLLILSFYCAQIRTTNASMKLFVLRFYIRRVVSLVVKVVLNNL